MGKESRAERKGKIAAQEQYWKIISGIDSMVEGRTVDTQGTRKLGDQLGNNMSAQTKKLARQTDELGRKMNPEIGDYNQQVGRFNGRYDALKRQMNGETVLAYHVTSAPITKVTDSMANAIEGWRGYSGGPFGKDAGDMDFIYDRNEAMTRAAAADKVYQDSLTPQQKSMAKFQGMGKEYLSSGLNSIGKTSAVGTHLATETMGPVSESYRTLGATKQAYKDLNSLASQVGNTNFAQFAQQYETIGQRLKHSVARDVRMSGNPASGGLIQSDVITGNGSPIDNEVIRA